MKYKEFVQWCNQRACDGCWGTEEAIVCIEVMGDIRKEPFWRREKVWRKKFEVFIVDTIVCPTNELIELRKEGRSDD